jgi:hypothetical protein
MRSISLLLGILGLCIGCKEEAGSPLAGTWRIVDTYTVDDVVGKNYGGSLVDTAYYYYTYEFGSSDFTYTFSENPNEVVSEGELTYFVYVLGPGLQETHTVSFNSLSGVGAWEITNDTLILTYSAGEVKRIIEELSNTTLRYREDHDHMIPYNGGILHETGSVYTVLARE